MMLLVALALATAATPQDDASSDEILRAFAIVRTNAVEPVSDETIAKEAARQLSMTEALTDRVGPGDPSVIKDESALVSYFAAVRARTAGRVDTWRLIEHVINGMVAATGHGGGYLAVPARPESTIIGPASSDASGVSPDGPVAAVPTASASVAWQVRDPVGVIAVARLDAGTVAATVAAIHDMRRQLPAPAGYVLDLRGNQGGLLGPVSALADLFMDSGPIGYQQGRRVSDIERYAATPGDVLDGAALIVLTDGSTASGAEMVAAALQESGRARVVGQKTVGNGEIRSVVLLTPHSAIVLTTGRYFTARGNPIDHNGVTPDVETAPGAPGIDGAQTDGTLAAALALLAHAHANAVSSRVH